MSQIELINILKELKSIDSLQRMFVEELNFSPASEDLNGFITQALRENVTSATVIAEHTDFKVITFKLKKLRKGYERRIVEQLSKHHGTRYNITIFVNTDEDEYHFTNLKFPKKEKRIIEEKIRPFRRLVVGRHERLRTAAERLEMIEVDEDDTPFDVQLKTDRAFDVEEVGRLFYKDFVSYYKGFRSVLKNKNRLKQDLADTYTQNIFNRLFFIYFIQKLNYLNRDPEFIIKSYRNIGKKNYYNEFIVPLFQKLAIPKYKHEAFNQVPFLNGGLFEFDKKEINLKVPNDALGVIIENLFEHYNFTIREDTEFEQEVAIDPEMMGTIFEQLILGLESKEFKDLPDPRRETGSYYTKKFIVAFMVKNAILNDLSYNLKDIPRQDLKRIVFNLDCGNINTDHLNSIKKRLKEIKIIDPGVGSGAYPVGFLTKVVEIVETIDSKIASDELEKRNYRYNLKREIIEKCIYGVDIQERAVHLAQLRLWLSLIVDLRVETIDEIPPLPNLDFHIMCGDSLVSTIAGFTYDEIRKLDPKSKGSKLLNQFKELKSEFESIADLKDKEKTKAKIDSIKIELYEWLIDEQIQKLQDRVSWHTAKMEFEFEGIVEGKESKSIKKEVEKLQERINKLHEIKRQRRELIAKEFNWGLDFIEVELSGGFDIAIANPPYGVKVNDKVRNEFGLESKDSYGVFTVLGLRILKPHGTLCYIMSDTWQTIKTHKKLREILLAETNVQYLISLPSDVFKATVNTGVYTFIKRPIKRRKYDEDADNWILASDFSPLKIRQEGRQEDSSDLEAAFELIIEINNYDDTKDSYTVYSDKEYAIYLYRQKLIPKFSNLPFFIASPKLFKIMRDIGNIKNVLETTQGEVPRYSVEINAKEITLVKLGDIAKVIVGLQTGDNDYYLRQSEERIEGASKNYKVVEWDKVLSESDLQHISSDNELRLKIIQKGISLRRNSKRYFNGKYFVPYEKGGSSDIEQGWLPNYFKPSDYYIDWSENSVMRIKALTSKQRNKYYGQTGGNNKICSRFQNSEYYFKNGISFSDSGVYSPTYRISIGHLFDQKGSLIIPHSEDQIDHILGIVTSKINLYLLKNFCNHSISSHVDSIKLNLIPQNKINITNIVQEIVRKQKINLNYDYMTNEKIELDKKVYEMYNLNKEDIQEVESWYYRKYPKLAKSIEAKIRERGSKK